MTQSIELARQEGEEFRTVRLTVSSEGVALKAIDAGPAVERTWGRDEYEFWVDVQGTNFPNLVFALLREKFAGEVDAVDRFHEFCQSHNIPFKFDTWA